MIRKGSIEKLVTKGMRIDVNVYYVKDNNGSNYLLVQVCGEWNQTKIELELENEVIPIVVEEKKAIEVKIWINIVEEDQNQIEESQTLEHTPIKINKLR